MSTIKNPFTNLRSSGLLKAETSREGDRATTLELFFDLIYVFAFTQVSALMSNGHDGFAVLQGLVILALIWWSWTSYTWLANQAHADRGVVRIGIMLAIALMFIVSLVIPEAYHDLAGGLFAPMVFVVAYVAVRVVHMVVYIVAAGSDAGLRRQIILSMCAALIPSSALLVLGAFAGAPLQVWIWLVAIVLDLRGRLPHVAWRQLAHQLGHALRRTPRSGDHPGARRVGRRHRHRRRAAAGQHLDRRRLGARRRARGRVVVGVLPPLRARSSSTSSAARPGWSAPGSRPTCTPTCISRSSPASSSRRSASSRRCTRSRTSTCSSCSAPSRSAAASRCTSPGRRSSGAGSRGSGRSSAWAERRSLCSSSPLLAVIPAIVALAVIAVIVGAVVGAEQFFGGRAKIRTNPEASAAAAEA